MFTLPAETESGDVQPMIGVKANQYPELAEDFARTRIAPSKSQLNRIGGTTLAPQTKGLALPGRPSMFTLPAETESGEVQPMIGVKAPPRYPALAEEFARDRIQPNFTEPKPVPSLGIRGLLPEKTAPGKTLKTLLKKKGGQ